ncbi:MAG: PDGLE domain-containing protein [Candidatus Bathyarchaeia archaeon]
MKGCIKALILIIVGFAVLLPFASSYPDGLETVAGSLNVGENEPLWKGLMPDYTLPAVENPYLTNFFAGVFGMFLVFALAFALGKVISPLSE